MAIQNDNTLVTKGDLKELYTDKIAPYLGGGVSYYYSDRTGEELQSAVLEMEDHQTISQGTSQNTLLNFNLKNGSYIVSNHKVIIPEGQRIQVDATIEVSPGSGNPDGGWQIYDYKNNNVIAQGPFAFVGSGYAWSSTVHGQYTVPEGGAEIGIKVVSVYNSSVKITTASTWTVQEIGRIVDPVKYVSNNSDLQETPVGNIISYMGNSVPKHYLPCDGTEYFIGSYPELEAFFIEEFGSINYFGGDGTTKWAVPDLRGEFLRGTGTNGHSGQGNGANVGIHQDATEHRNLMSGPKSWTNIYFENADGDYAGAVNPDSNTQHRDASNSAKVDFNSISGDYSTTHYTARPTNTSVKYCIKYESTYHAFFSNAAYKVEGSFDLTYDSTNKRYNVSSITYTVGDSSLIDGAYFVAPMDGWYAASFKSSQVTYTGTAVQYLGIMSSHGTYHLTNGTGSGTGHTHFGIEANDVLYLTKGDKVTYQVWTNGGTIPTPDIRKATFCLLESNYNPTIVSADSVYSENEQMIGYWKNGKPLYQKTIKFNSLSVTANSWTTICNVSTLNIDEIINANSFGQQLNEVLCGGYRLYSGNLQMYSWVAFQLDGVTVQYTKTTDTASSLQVENSLLLNRPDLWTAGTEYHFGGGLYGMRLTAAINSTLNANGGQFSVEFPITGYKQLVSQGGYVDCGSLNYHLAVPSSWGSNVAWDASIWFNVNSSKLIFALMNNSTSAKTITNGKYDAWVLYKK